MEIHVEMEVKSQAVSNPENSQEIRLEKESLSTIS
jgi:hypothetical protein